MKYTKYFICLAILIINSIHASCFLELEDYARIDKTKFEKALSEVNDNAFIQVSNIEWKYGFFNYAQFLPNFSIKALGEEGIEYELNYSVNNKHFVNCDMHIWYNDPFLYIENCSSETKSYPKDNINIIHLESLDIQMD